MKIGNYQQEYDSLNLECSTLKIARFNISSLTPKTFFEQYQKAGIPVIITGLLNTIPDWNLDYLCKYLGNQEFPIRYYGRSRYQQDKREWRSFGSSVETRVMPFCQYAEMLRNGEAYEHDNYLGQCVLLIVRCIQRLLISKRFQIFKKPFSIDKNVFLTKEKSCLYRQGGGMK